MSMQIVRHEVSRLLEKFGFVNCLETGTIRSFHEKHESTRHISEVIGNNGHLLSIDIEAKHIKVAKEITGDPANVSWLQGDSLEVLENLKDNYQFILLDSVNDKDHIMKEFNFAWPLLTEGGCLIVDDCGVDEQGNKINAPPQKGVKVYSFCQQNKLNFKVKRSGHGTQLIIYKEDENV